MGKAKQDTNGVKNNAKQFLKNKAAAKLAKAKDLKNKINRARHLRAQARKALRKRGQPIPASLQKHGMDNAKNKVKALKKDGERTQDKASSKASLPAKKQLRKTKKAKKLIDKARLLRQKAREKLR